ncbi:MAG: hypothetical protein ACOCT9_00075 [archaeon]
MGNWDFKNKAVQQYDNPESSGQLGSKAVLLSFGPPMYDPDATTIVSGFVQNMNMNQQRQIQELFEIGSERRYWVDGPTRNNLSLSRALFSGPSLLKIAGRGLLNDGIDGEIDVQDDMFKGGSKNAVASGADKNFWINLGSDFFKNPLGLMIQFREFYGNGQSSSYGAVYLQNAKISAHSLSMQAGNWLMQENIQMMFEHPVPLSQGSTHEEHYAKRQEIMDSTHNMTPEWFEEYNNWMGESTQAPDGSNADN